MKVPGSPNWLVYNLKLFKLYSAVVGSWLPKIKSVSKLAINRELGLGASKVWEPE